MKTPISSLYVPDRETVANWNPFATDTDEWARVSASFGAKYIVLVADHVRRALVVAIVRRIFFPE